MALAFTWLSFKKDCAKLDADAHLYLTRENGKDPPEWRLEIALRNRGRRPCYVETIGLAVAVESLSFSGLQLPIIGPVVFNLYDSKKSGAIALEESQRRSITVAISESHLQMLHSGSQNGEGSLIIVDSLAREVRCAFRLPEKEHIALTKGNTGG